MNKSTQAFETTGDSTESVDEPIQALGEIGLQNFAPYLMNRITGRYNSTVQSSLSAMRMTTTKLRVLAVLSVIDGISVNELAVYTVTEQSTLSRTLASLEDEGYVRSDASDSDNRIRVNYLTQKGSRLFAESWPHMHKAYRQMFQGIPDDEADAFINTLRKMLRNVRVHEL